jgi:hypothetical protein
VPHGTTINENEIHKVISHSSSDPPHDPGGGPSGAGGPSGGPPNHYHLLWLWSGIGIVRLSLLILWITLSLVYLVALFLYLRQLNLEDTGHVFGHTHAVTRNVAFYVQPQFSSNSQQQQQQQQQQGQVTGGTGNLPSSVDNNSILQLNRPHQHQHVGGSMVAIGSSPKKVQYQLDEVGGTHHTGKSRILLGTTTATATVNTTTTIMTTATGGRQNAVVTTTTIPRGLGLGTAGLAGTGLAGTGLAGTMPAGVRIGFYAGDLRGGGGGLRRGSFGSGGSSVDTLTMFPTTNTSRPIMQMPIRMRGARRGSFYRESQGIIPQGNVSQGNFPQGNISNFPQGNIPQQQFYGGTYPQQNYQGRQGQQFIPHRDSPSSSSLALMPSYGQTQHQQQHPISLV